MNLIHSDFEINSLTTRESDPIDLDKNDQNQLNDSIELFYDKKVKDEERRIVQYLRRLGIQTKTNPLLKEEQFWLKKRNEGRTKIDQLCLREKSSSSFTLNLSMNKIFRKHQASTCNSIITQAIDCQNIY
ncbi:hypothetical protein FGO68_gene3939 [Halteria grandinella]|uniref:Uncharacterized protein n=1 Tax=Halteria grandinella TaxID=5974 RepID=A0A8J8NGS5_HALGN|nr:hypothetical protein FGO68_gene3939 [Halteria grandinella]